MVCGKEINIFVFPCFLLFINDMKCNFVFILVFDLGINEKPNPINFPIIFLFVKI